MKISSIALCVLLSACVASPSVPVPQTLPEAVEMAEPIYDPSELEGFDDFPAVGLAEGMEAPQTGILVSPYMAAELAVLQAAAERWHREATSLRWQMGVHDRENERYILRLEEELKPSFWDRHGPWVSASLGILAGIGLTLGVYAASNEI